MQARCHCAHPEALQHCFSTQFRGPNACLRCLQCGGKPSFSNRPKATPDPARSVPCDVAPSTPAIDALAPQVTTNAKTSSQPCPGQFVDLTILESDDEDTEQGLDVELMELVQSAKPGDLIDLSQIESPRPSPNNSSSLSSLAVSASSAVAPAHSRGSSVGVPGSQSFLSSSALSHPSSSSVLVASHPRPQAASTQVKPMKPLLHTPSLTKTFPHAKMGSVFHKAPPFDPSHFEPDGTLPNHLDNKHTRGEAMGYLVAKSLTHQLQLTNTTQCAISLKEYASGDCLPWINADGWLLFVSFGAYQRICRRVRDPSHDELEGAVRLQCALKCCG